jgi:hypothetical protein
MIEKKLPKYFEKIFFKKCCQKGEKNAKMFIS